MAAVRYEAIIDKSAATGRFFVWLARYPGRSGATPSEYTTGEYTKKKTALDEARRFLNAMEASGDGWAVDMAGAEDRTVAGAG